MLARKIGSLEGGKIALALLVLLAAGGLVWATYDMHTHSDCIHPHNDIITYPSITCTCTHTLRACCKTGTNYWVEADVTQYGSYKMGPIWARDGGGATDTETLTQDADYAFHSSCDGSGGWALLTSTTPPNCNGMGPGGP